MRTTHRITTKHSSFIALVMIITLGNFGAVLLKTVILANFLLKNWTCFYKVKHCFAISQEWLVRLMWNEKEVHRFNTGYNVWPWPLTSLMTLTLDVSRSNFQIAVSQELLVWLMWNEKKVSWYDTGPTVWHCPMTTPMTLTLEFQGQSLKLLYLRNGVANWHGTKRMWVIHSWPWYWLVWPWWGGRMYRIMNGVTSDVGVPSTYLVTCHYMLGLQLIQKECGSSDQAPFDHTSSAWNMDQRSTGLSSVVYSFPYIYKMLWHVGDKPSFMTPNFITVRPKF